MMRSSPRIRPCMDCGEPTRWDYCSGCAADVRTFDPGASVSDLRADDFDSGFYDGPEAA